VHLEPWHVWTIVALVLVIGETATAGFLLACFALGALAAGLVSYWHGDLTLQLVAFSAASLAGFWGVRPFALKALGHGQGLKTNAEALVGKPGVVLERVDPASGKGRVKVEGEDWWGVTEAGRALEPGERVVVLAVDGTRLVVEPEAAIMREE